MPIERFLTHLVSIVRQQAVLDGMGQPTFDDYGQPIVSLDTVASSVPAGIQPKSAREVANLSQAGAAISDHTVFTLPIVVTTGDLIVHEEAACPMAVDLPDGNYEIVSVPSAAGAGHHLEIDTHRVDSPASSGVLVPTGGSGS